MPQTISQLLQLAKPKIDFLDAQILIAHVLNKTREFVVAHTEMKIERSKDQKIKKMLKLRANKVPLAYLTGHKEFFGLDFIVNKNVLIPRPETELMVELAIEKIRRTEDLRQRTDPPRGKKIILIDVGTGSGCIPIAIAKNINHWSSEMSPQANFALANRSNFARAQFDTPKIYATDISKPALEVAKKNAKRHNTKIKFLHGDLLQPFFDLSIFRSFNLSQIILIANLPYLTPQQLKTEPSIQHEPKLALVAGIDGLKYYHQLLKQIRLLVTSYQSPVTVYLEIDPSQTSSIKLLIKKYLPKAKIKIKKDLAGLNRIVEIIT